jgi:hypothetical protein
MPSLTRADKEQIDAYINSGQVHLARRMLEESDDPKAAQVLTKLNQKYPPSAAPSFTPPPPLARPAAPLKAQSPAPTAAADDMEDAKRAIREKRYDDAEALLILSDHPDAPKLLERLAIVRSSTTNLDGKVRPVSTLPQKDFTNKLQLASILIFFALVPGVVAFELFAAEARQYPDAPGAQDLLRKRRNVLVLTAILLFLLAVVAGFAAQGNYSMYSFS